MAGPDSNHNAVGSFIRLIYEDGSKDSARFIQTGRGYFSQNSYNQVLGYKNHPRHIEITWFDVKITKVDYMEGVMEYTIQYVNE